MQAAKAATRQLRPSPGPSLSPTPKEPPTLHNTKWEKIFKLLSEWLELADSTMSDFLVVIDNGQLTCLANGGYWIPAGASGKCMQGGLL